ncbi:hypothetical protein DMN77_18210 [Paenibacillus sp. 79R4]|uniref:GerAB/ArcD/ProY family transporter n=1 Tax=Paenibacillus sp. 79R4 TaxID=2212847 RepID=UPI0015B97600|nr:GerAB/ArcD/ProY family transporter [Paenibacillus sp. 79R4]NWL89490.1 hypothetical protein [Paenibacillus sp. 79R4]
MKPTALSTTQFFGLQIMVLGAISFYLYPYLVINSTSHGFWIPIMIWMLLSLVGAWLFSRMMALHQGKDAFTIVKKELGWLGILLFVLPLIWYMWRSMVVMVSAHTEIIGMTILHTTPGWVLNGIIWIAVFLASGGFGSIVRTASIFLLVSFPISIILFLLAMSDTHLYLGKPWLQSTGDFLTSPRFYASSCIWTAYLYLAVCGQFSKKPGKLWKSYAAATICFIPLILGSVYLPVLTFGAEMSRNLTLPYISKMDTIYHYWLIIENLTAVFISSSMLYLILALAIMVNLIVTAVKVIFPSWNDKLLYLLTGAITYASTLLVPSWEWIERALMINTPFRLYLMFLFPLVVVMKSMISERMKSRS